MRLPHRHKLVHLPNWHPSCRRCGAVNDGTRWHRREPADAQAFLDAYQEEAETPPDLTYLRYDTPTGMCDHPETEQRWAIFHDGLLNVIARSDPITVCTTCNEFIHPEEDQ